MSWRQEILKALRTRLLTTPGLSGWIVVVANREPATKPTALQSWIDEGSFETSSDDAGVGNATRWREVVGTWQLMLCVPPDSDVFPALAFADVLESTFLAAPSLTLTSGDAIRISNVLVQQPREARANDPWVRIPVVFTFTVTTHT